MDHTPIAPAGTRALVYDGRIGDIYAIFLLNLLFTILTLGIFRFWAITRYRRYFWSRFSFQGERFEYTGTGGELFVGFLLAGLVLIGMAVVALGLGFGLSQLSQPLAAIPIVLYYVAVLTLALGAVFSAQRYRLSRTLWSGIRGGMTGSMIRYGARSLLYTALTILTLGQLVPWTQMRLTERRINASSLGSARFAFAGKAGRLYLAYLATLLGTLALFAVVAAGVYLFMRAQAPELFVPLPANADPKLQYLRLAKLGYVPVAAFIVFGLLSALVSCWYTALFERHVVGRSSLGPVRFASSMTGRGLLGLVIGNLLITVFTLGFGYPIVLHRNARFLASTLWAQGTLDTDALRQSTLAAPAFGEGMFQQLDATGWM